MTTPYANAEKVRRSYPVRFAQVQACYLGGNTVKVRRGTGEWQIMSVSEAIGQMRHWQYLDRRRRKSTQVRKEEAHGQV